MNEQTIRLECAALAPPASWLQRQHSPCDALTAARGGRRR
jgi:hypothetical protein